MSQFKLLSTNRLAILGLVVSLVSGLVAFSNTGTASAGRIGVGVGTGRINLTQSLKPGLTYKLPSIAVFNNGSVESDYAMSMQFNRTQSQLQPRADWVRFSPQHFNLKPGKSRLVTVSLRTSSSAHPGSYFAYIEAKPLKKDVTGEAAINIAAATKLSFKVAPANFLQKLYYWLVDFWNKHKPLIVVVLILAVGAAVITLSNRYLKIEVSKKPVSKSK